MNNHVYLALINGNSHVSYNVRVKAEVFKRALYFAGGFTGTGKVVTADIIMKF